MTDQTQDETPKHPYVKFKAMFKHTDSKTRKSTDKPEFYFLDISGVHGRTESLMEFEKMGHVIVDFGNLTLEHRRNLTTYLNSRTGRGLDPRLAAMDADPMAEKVEAARGKK